MEKLANKNKLSNFLKNYTLIVFLIMSFFSKAQDIKFNKGSEYVIEEISVTGLTNFNEHTVITYTGLRPGQKVRIPGEEISAIISKLWKLDLFSDINFYLIKLEGNKASIEKIKEKMRIEIKKGLLKEKILNESDKVLLHKFYLKIQNEFKDIEK